MRYAGWMMMTMVCMVFQGCFGSMIAALTAPESVIASTATALVDQGAAAINGANQAANTVSDIDRILSANPDAVNHGELMALRDELGSRSIPESGKRKGIAPPPDEFDRRLPPSIRDHHYSVGQNQGFRQIGQENQGTTLSIEREVVNDLAIKTGRHEVRPFAAARTSSIPPARESIYQYSWNANPRPLTDERRDNE